MEREVGECARWVRAATVWGDRALDAIERAEGATLRYIDAVIRFEKERGRRLDPSGAGDRAWLVKAGVSDATGARLAIADEYLHASRGYAWAAAHAEWLIERSGATADGASKRAL